MIKCKKCNKPIENQRGNEVHANGLTRMKPGNVPFDEYYHKECCPACIKKS